MGRFLRSGPMSSQGGLFSKINSYSGGRDEFGDISLERKGFLAIGPKDSVRLSEFEFAVLWLLVRAQGKMVSKDEMYGFIYGEESIKTNNIDVFVYRVRKKLASIKTKTKIETVHMQGHFLK